MIIACPSCGTRYAVPDSAIGAQGRTVRCANCRHSWFQDGPVGTGTRPIGAAPRAAAPAIAPPPPASPPPAPVAEAEPEPDPAPAPSLAKTAAAEPASTVATPPEPQVQPEPEPEPEFQRPPPIIHAPPVDSSPPRFDRWRDGDASPAVSVAADDLPSQFEPEPPFRPRRNPAKFWTRVGLGFALVAASAIGAIQYFGLPDLLGGQSLVFAAPHPDLVIDFPAERHERRMMPSGDILYSVAGTIRNKGTSEQQVPEMLVVLRGAGDRIVYSWIVKPPVRTLGPGQKADFTSAAVGVPRSGEVAEIGWKQPG